MASIKNIQLKGVKTFSSRNGYGFEANIYMDNKRIGSASDKGNGGIINTTIYPEFKQEFNKRVNDEETFLNELFILYLTEEDWKKQVKKYVKKGMPNAWLVVVKKSEIDNRTFVAFNDEHVKKILDSTNGGKCIVYKSKEDFIR